MKFKFDMNKVKTLLKVDLFTVALLLVLSILIYGELKMFNALLFVMSGYFSARAVAHWYEDFYLAYMLFTASAGVFFSWAVWLLFVMADKHSLTKCSRSISMSTT